MLLQRFQQHIKEHFPQLSIANSKLLLAVSGGLDSVVLTDLIDKTGFDFIIAHCNFQLRGEESARDENFVKTLAEKYQKEVLVKRFDTNKEASSRKLSIQEVARELRYHWFAEVLNDKLTDAANFTLSSFILTAHHANDNIETLLMHIFRGTGIHGLTGIPAVSKERKIIRPLLFAKREEILKYAEENKLPWIEDSSNASDKYTRNLFRNKLLPSIAEVFPQVQQNLMENIDRFAEAGQLYDEAISLHKKKLLEYKGTETHIPILKLKKVVPLKTITYEIIKDFGFKVAQTDEVLKLLDAENGSYIQSSSHRIIKNRAWLIIAPNASEQANNIIIEKDDKQVNYENGRLSIETFPANNYQLSTVNNVVSLDAAEIKFPLLLRKWKQGDYFYPLGMQKKKKLSRFLIDQKLSKTAKEKVWVLEMNKKIVWIVGYRIDDRFKMTAKTKDVLKISFSSL